MKKILYILIGIVIVVIVLVIVGMNVQKSNPDKVSARSAPAGCALHTTALSPTDLPKSWGTYVSEYQVGTSGGYADDKTLAKAKTGLSSAADLQHYFARKLSHASSQSLFMGIFGFATSDDATGEWLFMRQHYQDLIIQSIPTAAQAELGSKFVTFNDIPYEHSLINVNSIQPGQGNEWVFIAHESNVMWLISFHMAATATSDDVHSTLLAWTKKVANPNNVHSDRMLCQAEGG